MISGTIEELKSKIVFGDRSLTKNEIYILVELMEYIGQARCVGQRDMGSQKGRRPKIYEINETANFLFSQKTG